MRRIFANLMIIAGVAITFISCQKEISAPEDIDNNQTETTDESFSVNLTLNTAVEETKTYLDENLNVLWGKGEAVTLYVGANEAKFTNSTLTDDYDGAATASFEFALTDVSPEGPYNLGGVYPASAALSDNDNPDKFKVILPATQNAESGKYDPTAYIMILRPEEMETLPTEYQAYFRRAAALNKITLTGVKEDISTVEITVPTAKALSGRRYFNLTDGTSGEVYYGQSNTITVNSAFTGSSIDVWFCSWGVELAEGENLTIRMKNANNVYTRTITARTEGIKFVEGDLNKLTVNMTNAEVESLADFEGEWLITSTSGVNTYAATAYTSGNNLSSPVQIEVNDGLITEVDGIANCKMTFTKLTEGDYKGMYTIEDANGNYLYAASSSSNHLKGGELEKLSPHCYWIVECNDGKYSIVASKSSNRNVMQFNPNGGSPIFSCYSSASQTPIVLYPYSSVKPDITPRIVVSGETSKNIGYEGEELTFEYSLKNLDGKTLNVAISNPVMLSTSASAGVLTVTVAANEGEAREATITLTCGEAAEVVLKVTQGAKPVEGGEQPNEPVVILSEQFDNTTASDASNEYATSKFPNFPDRSKAYTSQYGGIKFGSKSASGYITSKSLDLSSAFTVQIDACKYGSDTGNIVVTVGTQSQTINNSDLGAAGTFKTFTLNFSAATSSSTVTIATSSKRAYIDNVVITKN